MGNSHINLSLAPTVCPNNTNSNSRNENFTREQTRSSDIRGSGGARRTYMQHILESWENGKHTCCCVAAKLKRNATPSSISNHDHGNANTIPLTLSLSCPLLLASRSSLASNKSCHQIQHQLLMKKKKKKKSIVLSSTQERAARPGRVTRETVALFGSHFFYFSGRPLFTPFFCVLYLLLYPLQRRYIFLYWPRTCCFSIM